MKLFTVGFTKKKAQQFFELLCSSGAQRIVDVRLNNVSQLAGFAKKDDLAYFAKTICGVDYVHLPELAPTQEMLDQYKKQRGDWDTYEQQFLDLMRQPAPDRGCGAQGDSRRQLSAVQRREAASLPPPPRGRVPEAALG